MWVGSEATGAPDEVLHRRMQASDDAAAIRDALGLKCRLVMQEVWPVRTATAAWVCVSHRRSEVSAETEKAQVRTGAMCQGKTIVVWSTALEINARPRGVGTY